MLNSAKTDLLWGRQDEICVEEPPHVILETVDEPIETSTPTTHLSPDTAQTGSNNNNTKGHNRRPSTVSVMSTNSAASTISDNESEISNENDSGIESEGNSERDKSDQMAKQFRKHLIGLYKSLEQMTEAANYLTHRYQSDVGTV